jgi:hypothetical protein
LPAGLQQLVKGVGQRDFYLRFVAISDRRKRAYGIAQIATKTPARPGTENISTSRSFNPRRSVKTLQEDTQGRFHTQFVAVGHQVSNRAKEPQRITCITSRIKEYQTENSVDPENLRRQVIVPRNDIFQVSVREQ